MIKQILFLMLSAFALVKMAGAQEVPAETAPSEVMATETPFDIFSLRDPFVSSLPKKIIKTPVEDRVQIIDNKLNPPIETPVTVVAPPAPVPVPVLPKLELQGIFWSDKPQAIISDRVVEAGDTIEGVLIRSIRKDGVDMFYSGRVFHVPMDE
jgi:hypothetical protein